MNISKQDIKTVLLWTVIWGAAMTFAFLVPLGAHAQAVNCNSLVALDEAHVFSDSSAIGKAASSLIDQGADVHVVSTNMAGVSALSSVESKLEASCPSWLAAGHRKPNLFVMLVSPTEKKKNVFFGAAYTPAMSTEDAVNLTYSQAANPYFKQGDFSGGMAAALMDFSAKVAAYHDQAKHPVQQVVNNQATDLHGFWVVMGWGLVLLALGLGTWGVFMLVVSRRRRRDEIAGAQASAVKARDRAMRIYQSIPPSPSTSSRLVDLTNSISNDPSTAGLTVGQYFSIRDIWNDFALDMNPTASTDAPPKNSRRSSVHNSRSNNATPPPQATPSASYPSPQPSTVVVNQSSSGDMLTGMLIGEEFSRPRERDAYVEPTPSYSEPEPSYESLSSGSDSSWSSSSDDSSSSGSDSSFDSGSSDFGGGGSDSGF